MRCSFHISLFLLLATLASCSNTRFLAGEELLYTGRKELKVIPLEEDVRPGSVKSQVRSTTTHKVNNALFGKRVLPPVGLWVYNYWEEKEDRKVSNWLYNSLSAPPILVSDVNPDLRTRKIENDLFDRGYFNTRSWFVVDTSNINPRKAGISYFVEFGKPYRYGEVRFRNSRNVLDTLQNEELFRERIRSGEPYELQTLSAARRALSRDLQNRGFFYFSPDFIELQADTTVGDHRLDLTVGTREDLPPEVLSRYWIDDIDISVIRYSDTTESAMDSLEYEGLHIYTTGNYLRPAELRKNILFHTRDLYTYTDYQQTISRLNSLGIFSNVRISYTVAPEDSAKQILDVRIDLLMADHVSLDLEADLVTKSSGFLGPVVSAGISHGNLFGGAERIQIQLNGGFEWQWQPGQRSELGSFSYEIGGNAGLTFPRLILPGRSTGHLSLLKQQTSLNQSFRLLNRTAYYTMSSALTNVNYSWGRKTEITHSFSPLYLNSVNLLATTPAFDSVINDNIYIRKSFEEQFIFGWRYDFTYDNTPEKRTRNSFFYGSIGTSGNLLDGFQRIRNDPAGRPFEFLGNVYSQFIKLATDYRYYLHGYNRTLAMRLYAGIGIPYLNSTVLPYTEQFFSGGAYSVRGFLARSLGPGSFHEQERSFIDQSGDLKLEASLEYRFDISRILKGALFLDAGNIWLVNEDAERPGSRFRFGQFHKELAIGSGIGFRFDFTFFVLRTDIGFPLRTPYLLDDRNWQPGTGNWLSNGMFYLAIGYPF